ncbi:hypothetical protein BKA61DRAFT_679974 [Leptodontidium sp. MPI-SDFR-AT-0119]|nr:hypothetical protein BKA61DRAFT_679974 [Leptodontidium sp. MPI-SDFR-AT-0119]
MVGIISPGGFEVLFYALSTGNYISPTVSPYDPSIKASPTATPDDVFNMVLEGFDVVWHTGSKSLAKDSTTPFFVAKDYRPQYLNNQTGNYKFIQPFVVSV